MAVFLGMGHIFLFHDFIIMKTGQFRYYLVTILILPSEVVLFDVLLFVVSLVICLD